MLSFLSPASLEITLPIFNYRCFYSRKLFQSLGCFYPWEFHGPFFIYRGAVHHVNEVSGNNYNCAIKHLSSRAVALDIFTDDVARVQCEDGSVWLYLCGGMENILAELKERDTEPHYSVPSFSQLLDI